MSDQTPAAPPSPEPRFSPLHAAHVAAGASFTDFAGWQMPVRYSGDLAEHHAVRTAAGLFDLSHMAEILVIGTDAAAALDYALAGTISAIEVGRARYSLLLSASGGIIDDLVVYRTGEDRFMVVANAANRAAVAAELRTRTAAFDAESFDESDDIALIAIQGPASLGILRELPNLAIEGGHPDGEDVPAVLGALRYYRAVSALLDGHPLLIARTGYTGEDGFELYLAPEQALALWDALLEVGAGAGLVAAGLASRDTLRLEAGMPLYGHELGLQIMPAQTGLGRVVALDKPVDFVGRAASEDGTAPDAPVLVGLAGDGKRAARASYPVFPATDPELAEGPGASASSATDAGSATDSGSATESIVPIGTITSGALSPTLGHPIAMAYVAPAYARAGTQLAVDIRGTKLPFTVVTLPFYSRKKN